MTETPSAAADWGRNLAAVTLAVFIGFAGFTLVMPFLPLYFEQLGVHDPKDIAIWCGVCLGVTPAITAAMTPVWARVALRLGRKLMVARSLISFVVIMALLSIVRHPWQVLVLRAVQGVFAGYGPIAMTMAAESSPRQHMASAIGWVQTAQRLGPALGPVVGGALAQTVGLREAFLVAAGFYFAAFLLVVVGYRETRAASPRIAASDRAGAWSSLRLVPHFVLFVTMIFCLQLVDRSFGPVLPLYLRELGLPDSRLPFMSGVLFTLTAGAAAVGNQSTAWLVSHLRTGALVPAAAVVAAVGVGIFGASPATSVLMVAAVIFGLGIGVATTAIYTAAGRSVSSAARGAAFGYLTTAYLVGLAVSPVIAGFLGSFRMRSVFIADAIGLLAIAWTIHRRTKFEVQSTKTETKIVDAVEREDL